MLIIKHGDDDGVARGEVRGVHRAAVRAGVRRVLHVGVLQVVQEVHRAVVRLVVVVTCLKVFVRNC